MRLWVLLLFLLGISVAAEQPSTPVNLQNADPLGAELYAHSGATGMVMVVVHDKQVFIGGYGRVAPGANEKPQADSFLRLCSLTKIFTTDVFTKMALDHTVGLNDPLQKYAPPSVVVPSRKGSPITLEDLATHTAGLPRELAYLPDGEAHFTFPSYQTRWTWLPRAGLYSVPGTVASYSNIGFDLLSDALSSAGHKPYPALLDERTLKPLHMWETTFYPSASQCARLLKSDRDEGPCTDTSNTAGSSGLYSTPNDMARWLKYLLGTGGPGFPAQPAAAQAQYLQPASLVRISGLNYAGDVQALGLGWVHVLPIDDPSHLVEKTGGGAGFLTYIAIHPSTHTAIFVAMTDGRSTHGSHFNLFRAANSVLLKIVDRPLIPEPGVGQGRGGRLVAVRAVKGRGGRLVQSAPVAQTAGRRGRGGRMAARSEAAPKQGARAAGKGTNPPAARGTKGRKAAEAPVAKGRGAVNRPGKAKGKVPASPVAHPKKNKAAAPAPAKKKAKTRSGRQ